MISALFLINAKGEVIIHRLYRDDVAKSAADSFRLQVIAAKEAGSAPPVRVVDKTSFLHIQFNDIYFVVSTRSNVNCTMVFHFMYHLVDIFKAYFGEKFDEDAIRNNFTLVYELLDEVLDHGYPQNSAIDVLRSYINFGSLGVETQEQMGRITAQITGTIDWRKEGLRYRKNEVFIDVLEDVNLLMSANGTVLHSDVSGRIMMKTFLSGMPECKFGLNDKLLMDKEPTAAARPTRRRTPGVEIDDCTFHRCVRLKKFGADRTISFTPPDGEFELMRYRITENVNLPFRLLTTIEEEGKTRVMLNIKVIGNFSAKLLANNVVLTIPVPHNTARCKITCTNGKAKYEAENRALVWRIRRFPGGAEATLTGSAELIRSTSDKAWVRPPITVGFQVPMFTASGLVVRFLKVFERKENYQTTKWVRYITRAGQYQIRI